MRREVDGIQRSSLANDFRDLCCTKERAVKLIKREKKVAFRRRTRDEFSVETVPFNVDELVAVTFKGRRAEANYYFFFKLKASWFFLQCFAGASAGSGAALA